MKNRLRDCKGMTLAELLVASALAGVVALAASALSGMIFKAGTSIEAEFVPMTQANLTVEAIYQRILRAPLMTLPGGQTIAFQIIAGGSGLAYQAADNSGPESVQQVGDQVVLTTSDGDKQVLMHGVKALSFYPVPTNRLGIQVSFHNGRSPGGLASLFPGLVSVAYASSNDDTSTVSSSVFPRNTNTIRGGVN